MSYLGRGLEQVDNISKLDNITFNGGTTYALTKDSASFTPISSNAILISIDGVIQQGNFSVSGSNIVFNFSPTGSNTCDFILHYGTGVAFTPADSSITKDKTNFVSTSSAAGLEVKGDGTTDGTLQLNCRVNSHGVKLKSPPHSAGQSYTLTLPSTAPATDKMLQTDGSGNLSFVDAPSGAMTLIARSSGSSAVGDIAVDNCFSDTYDYYKIYAWLNAEDDEGELRFRFRKAGSDRTDNYYINTGYISEKTSSASQSYTGFQAWNGDHIVFLNNLNENDNMGMDLELTIYDPRARDEGNIATVQCHGSHMRDDSRWVNINSGGFYGNQGSGDDFDGFKFYINNSNIKFYDYAIYGFNKT